MLGVVLALTSAVFVAMPIDDFSHLHPRTNDARIRQLVRERQDEPPLEAVREVLAQHPPNMIYVPAGEFVRGRMFTEPEQAFTDEPLAEVVRLNGFLIDAFEYPNQKGVVPTTNVTHEEAQILCQGQSKRLCTADEWEKACKGVRSEVYQYGNTYQAQTCGGGSQQLVAAGSRPDCKSTWLGGPYDLSGNAAEWTETWAVPGRRSPLVKGGGAKAPSSTRCSFSAPRPGSDRSAMLSFRCCRGLFAPAWRSQPQEQSVRSDSGER